MADYAPEVETGEMVGDGVIVTCKAGAAITKGRIVTLSDATDFSVTQCGADGIPLGVALKAASAAGEYIPVLVRGIVKILLAGTVTAGKALKSAANGEPAPLDDKNVNEGGTATYTIYYNIKAGIALQSGNDNDYILMLVNCGG